MLAWSSMPSSESDCIIEDYALPVTARTRQSSGSSVEAGPQVSSSEEALSEPECKVRKPRKARKPREPRKPRQPREPRKPEPREPRESEGEEADEEGGTKKKTYNGSDQPEDRDFMFKKLPEIVKWFETNMKDHPEWPFPGTGVTYTLTISDVDVAAPTLRLTYNPVQAEEEGSASAGESGGEAPSVGKRRKSGKKRRASAKRSPHGFTATFTVKFVGGKTGEWGIHATVCPVANLKHLLTTEAIADITASAEVRGMQVRAAKAEGKRNIRVTNATKFVRVALPHFVGGQVGRYIFQVELFGGKSNGAQPYMKAFFGAGRINAFAGFLSKLALPESETEWDIEVGPDESVTLEKDDDPDEDEDPYEADEADEGDEAAPEVSGSESDESESESEESSSSE